MRAEGAVRRQRLGWLIVAFVALGLVATNCGHGRETRSVATPTSRPLGTSAAAGPLEGLWEGIGGLLTVRGDGSFALNERQGVLDHHAGDHATGTVAAEGVRLAFTYVPEEDIIVVSDIGGAHAQTFCGPGAAPYRCGQ